jgi:hypothetical protein
LEYLGLDLERCHGDKKVNAPDNTVPFNPALEEFYLADERVLIKAVAEIV